MKIDILCNDGSPIGVTCKDIYGEGKRGIGVGGAELALLTMCEEWHKRGDTVTLFNDPTDYRGSPFKQRAVHKFRPDTPRDVLIVFRSPNEAAVDAKGLKVWWSCDQYTVGSFTEFAPHMDRIVGISDFHKYYFLNKYRIDNMTVIDLPVRIDEYADVPKKIHGKCIFTSVPDRGLQILHAIWPLIKRDAPHATLTITSDYRLWGVSDPLNHAHRLRWAFQDGVKFLGAIPRRQLVQEELTAQLFLYPSYYDGHELFCISAAEAQVAGAYPITSTWGALATTNMGVFVNGAPTSPEFVSQFAKEVVSYLNNDELLERVQSHIRKESLERFSPEKILKEWDEKVFKDG